MKTAKSPKSEEITPSKKVLKQARLPFKLISDVSPKSNTTRPRKRKLSSTDTETASKIGKIKDQNKDTDVCVVISDEDSKDGSKTQNKTLNPFVKIVDVARKKKLQKKSIKKKPVQSKSSVELNSSEKNGTTNDCEVVSIDTDNDSVSAMEDDVDQDEEKGEEKTELSKKHEETETLSCNGNEADLTKDESDAEKEVSDHEDDKKESSVKLSKRNSVSCNGNEADLIKDESDAEKDASDHEDDIQESSVKPSPKRQTRSQKNNLNSSQTSKANESVTSNPSTPKRTNRSSSVTNSNGDTSLNESSNTNLTPKQQQKKLESAKKKEEREKERLEREKKRQQEKEERAKQKQEKEEQRKREKEEKEEAKRKEKEEKEKQKELEKKKEEKEEQKRKEREEKEEQKRKEKEAKEEEKRKKQEALELEKLEQEQKKKKAAEAFVSFFVPKQKIEKDQPTVSKNDRLSSFTIKSDMRLAPTIRSELSDNRKIELENLLSKQCVDKNKLYMHELREGTKKPQTSGKTWPLSDKDDDDVLIIEDELPPVDTAGEIQTCEPAIREKLRPKLLSFHENRRPPYWGTWRKRSKSIKPTQPFKMDQKLLDYDVDSDEEWEEEQEGESIDGSAAGSDDEPEDDYEVDNEVFVPHGYLSDEEATMDDDDVMSLSPETQKAKLKHLEDEFETQLKKPTEKLKPRMYGLLWVTEDGGKPDNCADVLWNYFGKLAMIMNDPTPLLQPSTEQEDTEKKKVKKKKVVAEGEQQDSPKNEKKKKTKVNDKEGKKPKEVKKTQEPKKNQPVINSFLTKLNNTT
ncbi:chromatin assembly factor 1 subunit A-like [Aricia agestis]|uniref:chromatin assembly factor 1 subunit A-like n=1 Tax=Aricia agestis TaxID=91739 RepID=UPI001C2018F0|nr:chromatin assembly factor 1 subunit A-like [Aricia agestis]